MIHYQTWPPQAILVSDWPIFKNLLLKSKRMTDDRHQVMAKAHIAFGKVC
jgi:hypothetical protein